MSSKTTPSNTTESNPSSAAFGMLFGLITVFAWAGYNLAATMGISEGFRPQDLSVLRFGVAGLMFLPLALGRFRGIFRQAGLGRLLLLSLLAGPLFGYVATAGYRHAPLSHGLVFAPAAVLVVGTILANRIGGEPITPRRISGGVVLLAGLVILSGFEARSGGPEILIGDVIFVAAGTMWGCFTFLLSRWKLAPMPATCGVSVISMLLCVPFYVIAAGGTLPAVPLSSVAVQAVMQGVVGGGLSVLTYMVAIRHLGGMRASTLPAFTPVAGLILAYLVIGELPSRYEAIGAAISTVGLLIALSSGKNPRRGPLAQTG